MLDIVATPPLIHYDIEAMGVVSSYMYENITNKHN